MDLDPGDPRHEGRVGQHPRYPRGQPAAQERRVDPVSDLEATGADPAV